ncbi:hypothetical protein QRX50_35245 [Amycolatopsis carbonis]|uniref:Uncharacterized protein n=1 Tax=Amycolatopsis carbonis TaxID=715471 RepID=A0A9Y2MTB2_9PSEU|nr:hypothetical protein [Amycolatopsis sp. 2-15]WIX76673.1 hypothetical protein QRX50_35245 [Amycolatopsis sp. 2-15]
MARADSPGTDAARAALAVVVGVDLTVAGVLMLASKNAASSAATD